MKNNFIVRFFAVIALAITAFAANAKEPSIDLNLTNVNFIQGEECTIPVCINSEKDVYGLQFKMTLPQELEYVGTEFTNVFNSDSFDREANYQSSNAVMVGIFPAYYEAFVSKSNLNDQVICNVKVRVKSGSNVASTTTIDMSAMEIILDKDGTDVSSPDASTVNITIQKEVVVAVLSAEPAQLTIQPGHKATVVVSLENSMIVSGLQLKVNTTGGVTFSGQPKPTDRCVPNTRINLSGKKLVISNRNMDLYQATGIITGNEGPIFSFDVEVPESFGESGTVTFSELEIAGKDDDTEYYIAGELLSIQIANGKPIYDAAVAKVNELQSKLDAALAQIEQNCPDVKSQFTGADVQTQIDNLRQAVNAAYNNGAIDFTEALAPYEGIVSAIEALVANAKAAQEAYTAEQNRTAENTARHNADTQALQSLTEAYEAAVANVAQNYGAERADLANAISEKLNTLKQAIEANWAAAAQGTYTTVVTDAVKAEVEEAINTYVAAAKAEYERKQQNAALHNADLDALQALKDEYAEAKANVEQNYGAERADLANAISEKLNTLKQAIETNWAAAAQGTYTTVVTDAVKAEVKDAINAYVAAAKAEFERKQQNAALHNADLDALQALKDEYAEAKANVEQNYGAERADLANAISEKLNTLKQAIETNWAAAAQGTYTTVVTDAVKAEVKESINAYVAAAKAEYERQVANEAAYDADLATLAALETALQEEAEAVKAAYPNFYSQDAVDAIQNNIDLAKASAAGVLASVAQQGTYSTPFNAEAIQAQIDALMTNAENASKNEEEQQRQATNTANYNADLAAIQALQQAFNNAVADINANYPNGIDLSAQNLIQGKINEVTLAAQVERQSTLTEGVYERVDLSGIQELIDTLLANAKAAQHEYNEGIYNEDVAAVEELQAALYDAIAEIDESYAEGKSEEEIAEIQALIDGLSEAVEAEYERTSEAGCYEKQITDADIDNIKDRIAEAIANAELAGINAIGERAESPVAIYTLRGARVERPIQGQVNIFMYADGRIAKVFVK